MIIDLSRPVTAWHQPFPPYAILSNSFYHGGNILPFTDRTDIKELALFLSSVGARDTVVLSKEYKRLFPEQIQHLTFTADIKNARDFQSKANMLEIYNTHQDPMEGLRLALRTMDTRGHYVGIAWYETSQDGRRRVLMAAPMIEGPELHYLFNGAHSKEIFEKAGAAHHPITVVKDYGDVCVCQVPSRSKKDATVKADRKTGEQIHYHDVRVSGLPVASRPDNHWANTQVEMECPETIHKLRRINNQLQVYWDDHGVAAVLAIRLQKQNTDPLTVQLHPIPGRPLIELDNRLRYNVFIETNPYGFPPARPFGETERSYLLMAYIEAVKDNSPRRDIYEMLFRECYEGMEDELIRVA